MARVSSLFALGHTLERGRARPKPGQVGSGAHVSSPCAVYQNSAFCSGRSALLSPALHRARGMSTQTGLKSQAPPPDEI